MAEECIPNGNECYQYTNEYGTAAIDIEYTGTISAICPTVGRPLSTMLRDVNDGNVVGGRGSVC